LAESVFPAVRPGLWEAPVPVWVPEGVAAPVQGGARYAEFLKANWRATRSNFRRPHRLRQSLHIRHPHRLPAIQTPEVCRRRPRSLFAPAPA
jgi:hypothetical protein